MTELKPMAELLTQEPPTVALADSWLRLMRETTPKQATDSDISRLAMASTQLNLNPLTGEIILAVGRGTDGSEGDLYVMVTRDGIRHALRDAGMWLDCDVVHEGDSFMVERTPAGRSITHTYMQGDRGPIVGAWAEAKTLDGDAPRGFFYAKMSEFEPENVAEDSVWATHPSVCILACAERQAGRQAHAGLGATMTLAERESMDRRAQPAEAAKAVDAPFSFEGLHGGAEIRATVEEINSIRPGAITNGWLKMTLGKASPEKAAEVHEELQLQLRALSSSEK